MTDKTIEWISVALDASLLWQTAIAHNMANMNTAGFQAMEVNFKEQLNNSLNEVQPFLQASTNNFSMDEQIALSIKNATHYRALIKGLNQKFALMKLALHGVNQA